MMADGARPHFCVDPARPQSYREDLVGAIAPPPQSRQTRSAASERSQSKAISAFNNQSI